MHIEISFICPLNLFTHIIMEAQLDVAPLLRSSDSIYRFMDIADEKLYVLRCTKG